MKNIQKGKGLWCLIKIAFVAPVNLPYLHLTIWIRLTTNKYYPWSPIYNLPIHK